MATSCDQAIADQRDIKRLLQALCTALGIDITKIGLEFPL